MPNLKLKEYILFFIIWLLGLTWLILFYNHYNDNKNWANLVYTIQDSSVFHPKMLDKTVTLWNNISYFLKPLEWKEIFGYKLKFVPSYLLLEEDNNFFWDQKLTTLLSNKQMEDIKAWLKENELKYFLVWEWVSKNWTIWKNSENTTTFIERDWATKTIEKKDFERFSPILKGYEPFYAWFWPFKTKKEAQKFSNSIAWSTPVEIWQWNYVVFFEFWGLSHDKAKRFDLMDFDWESMKDEPICNLSNLSLKSKNWNTYLGRDLEYFNYKNLSKYKKHELTKDFFNLVSFKLTNDVNIWLELTIREKAPSTLEKKYYHIEEKTAKEWWKTITYYEGKDVNSDVYRLYLRTNNEWKKELYPVKCELGETPKIPNIEEENYKCKTWTTTIPWLFYVRNFTPKLINGIRLNDPTFNIEMYKDSDETNPYYNVWIKMTINGETKYFYDVNHTHYWILEWYDVLWTNQLFYVKLLKDWSYKLYIIEDCQKCNNPKDLPWISGLTKKKLPNEVLPWGRKEYKAFRTWQELNNSHQPWVSFPAVQPWYQQNLMNYNGKKYNLLLDENFPTKWLSVEIWDYLFDEDIEQKYVLKNLKNWNIEFWNITDRFCRNWTQTTPWDWSNWHEMKDCATYKWEEFSVQCSDQYLFHVKESDVPKTQWWDEGEWKRPPKWWWFGDWGGEGRGWVWSEGDGVIPHIPDEDEDNPLWIGWASEEDPLWIGWPAPTQRTLSIYEAQDLNKEWGILDPRYWKSLKFDGKEMFYKVTYSGYIDAWEKWGYPKAVVLVENTKDDWSKYYSFENDTNSPWWSWREYIANSTHDLSGKVNVYFLGWNRVAISNEVYTPYIKNWNFLLKKEWTEWVFYKAQYTQISTRDFWTDAAEVFTVNENWDRVNFSESVNHFNWTYADKYWFKFQFVKKQLPDWTVIWLFDRDNNKVRLRSWEYNTYVDSNWKYWVYWNHWLTFANKKKLFIKESTTNWVITVYLFIWDSPTDNTWDCKAWKDRLKQNLIEDKIYQALTVTNFKKYYNLWTIKTNWGSLQFPDNVFNKYAEYDYELKNGFVNHATTRNPNNRICVWVVNNKIVKFCVVPTKAWLSQPIWDYSQMKHMDNITSINETKKELTIDGKVYKYNYVDYTLPNWKKKTVFLLRWNWNKYVVVRKEWTNLLMLLEVNNKVEIIDEKYKTESYWIDTDYCNDVVWPEWAYTQQENWSGAGSTRPWSEDNTGDSSWGGGSWRGSDEGDAGWVDWATDF